MAAMATDESSVGDIEGWLVCHLPAKDQRVALEYFVENAMTVTDFVDMASKAELEELEIGIDDACLELIWVAVLELQQAQTQQEHTDLTNTINQSAGPTGGGIPAPEPMELESDNMNKGDDTGSAGNGYAYESDPGTEPETQMTRANEAAIREGGMKGMRNLGNTCFMNTAIQCALQIPGFTHDLAKEVATQSAPTSHNDAMASAKAPPKQSKVEWVQHLAKGQDLDVFDASKDHDRWYAGQVLQIDIQMSQKPVNRQQNQGKGRKRGNGKKNKQSETTNKIDKYLVSVHYKSFGDSYNETLDISKPADFDRVDPPNAHAAERSYCQHWRHALKVNDELDYYDSSSYSGEWVVGRVSGLRKVGASAGIQVTVSTGYRGYSTKVVNVRKFADETKDTVAALGTHTDSESLMSKASSAVSEWWTGNGTGSNKPRDKRRGKQGGYSKWKNVSFYDAWLDMIDKVHLSQSQGSGNSGYSTNNYRSGYSNYGRRNSGGYGRGNSLAPEQVYRKMVEFDKSLGDGGQHDATEALTIILHGIGQSLPQHLHYGDADMQNFYLLNMDTPIYSKDFQGSLQFDRKVCDRLIEAKKLDFGLDLVSRYFQGIEKIEETCLNCGYQRRIYRTCKEMTLPVTSTDMTVKAFYYESQKREYAGQSLTVASDCTVKMFKFLMLCKIFSAPNQMAKMKEYDMIIVNKRNLSNLTNFGTILKNNSKLRVCGKQDILVLVRRIALDTGDSQRVKRVYVQFSNLSDLLYFCVLVLPKGAFPHAWLKQQMAQTKHAELTRVQNAKGVNCNQDSDDSKASSSQAMFETYFADDFHCRDTDLCKLNDDDNIFGYYIDSKTKAAAESGNSSEPGSPDYDDILDLTGYGGNGFNSVDRTRGNRDSHVNRGNKKRNGKATAKGKATANGRGYPKPKATTRGNGRRSSLSQVKLAKSSSKEAMRKSFGLADVICASSRIEAMAALQVCIRKSQAAIKQLEEIESRKRLIGNWLDDALEDTELEVGVCIEHEHLRLKDYQEMYQRLQIAEEQKTNMKQFLIDRVKSCWLKSGRNLRGCNTGVYGKYGRKLSDLDQCRQEYCAPKYMAKEQLAPAFDCECKDGSNNTVDFVESQTSLVRAPKVLIVSLDRGKGQHKQNHDVALGSEWRCEDEYSYSLCAVGNHSGGTSVQFGHWTATVKRLGTDQWYCCNDSQCYPSQYSSSDAIVMVYAQQ